jgi:hypothetical protein
MKNGSTPEQPGTAGAIGRILDWLALWRYAINLSSKWAIVVAAAWIENEDLRVRRDWYF